MLSASVKLARAIRRLHACGLAHSDLSYKNVLVDPQEHRVMLLDIDGLVVPGKHPPEVSGTPDFIAPEVVKTSHMELDDPQRVTPSIKTDRHALAVLIYCYLFRRHPLRGGSQIHSEDPEEDEQLSMGDKACWIEHEENKPDDGMVSESVPWGNIDKLPATIAGLRLAGLFERAFTEGLHDANERPTADEWEHALWRSCDLLRPCLNADCFGEWYVQLENTECCPFCEMKAPQLPTLAFYTPHNDKLIDENRRLVVHGSGLHLLPWHTNNKSTPNEFYDIENEPPIGYFEERSSNYFFLNLIHDGLSVNGKKLGINEECQLIHEDEWVFDEPAGRVLKVNMNE